MVVDVAALAGPVAGAPGGEATGVGNASSNPNTPAAGAARVTTGVAMKEAGMAGGNGAESMPNASNPEACAAGVGADVGVGKVASNASNPAATVGAGGGAAGTCAVAFVAAGGGAGNVMGPAVVAGAGWGKAGASSNALHSPAP